jgi:hypothetical protein
MKNLFIKKTNELIETHFHYSIENKDAFSSVKGGNLS